MAGFVRAVALDLDGTLAHGGTLSARAMEAVDAARADGLTVLLATGRIVAEMHAEFPQLENRFDAVVAENGAVLALPGGTRELARPIESELSDALAGRGLHVRRGQVLLAGSACDADLIAADVAALGLDCQLLRNRGELMVLPSGITKGTGLLAALDELGLSPHNTIAVGDAENDLALFDVVELGVAVANAVPSLKHHADLVLDAENGDGVADLLAGPLVRGVHPIRPERRRLTVGHFGNGEVATVPGAQANVLVCGQSGSGKSYMAGLLIEQWVAAGYAVLVVDMEGDHVGLGQLRNTVVLGDGQRLPGPQELVGAFRAQRLSVVLDLSTTPVAERAAYLREVGAVVEVERAISGVPHWIVVDEAHQSLGEAGAATEIFRPADLGYCLITYVPEQLSETARAAVDFTIHVTAAPMPGIAAIGGATLRERGGPERDFTPAARRTPHRRHWHKYVAAELPRHRWFRFREPGGAEVFTARDLLEFTKALHEVDAAAAEFHLCRGDFSRWVVGTLQDRELGAALGAVERDLLARRARDVERARERILAAIESRYGDASVLSRGQQEDR